MQKRLFEALLTHNQQVPRYTSYPTAPHFKEARSDKSVKLWLSQLNPDEPVSLYIHIPFCKKLCWYCGCNTKATQQYSPVKAYLHDLFKEIQYATKSLKSSVNVSHIHFGGGSPSLLSADDFTELMQHIKTYFSVLQDAEIAIELDPRETSEAKIAAYASAGVTRASLGIQDFNIDVQQAINRVQPFRCIYEVMKNLKLYGIEAVNFDLLYGLPHQTTASILDSVSLAAKLRPSRISLFGYAHVPWMKKHMRLINETHLPSAQARLEQCNAAHRSLKKKGYVPIGIDHFALPNDHLARAKETHQLQRNFQGYTTDSATTLIGFGPSAISSFPQGYAQNTPDQRAYASAVSNQTLPVRKELTLTDDDKARRRIISDIMCYGVVDLVEVKHTYNFPEDAISAIFEQIQRYENDGLVFINNDHITVNEDVPQAARLVAALFDAHLYPTQQQHSQVA